MMAQGSSNKTASNLLGWLRLARFAWSGKELLSSLPTAYAQAAKLLRPSSQIEENSPLLLSLQSTSQDIPTPSPFHSQLRLTIQQSWHSCNSHSLERITQTHTSPTDPSRELLLPTSLPPPLLATLRSVCASLPWCPDLCTHDFYTYAHTASCRPRPSAIFTPRHSHKISWLRGITPSISREACGCDDVDLDGRLPVLVKDQTISHP
jgi:hypothetical protein